MSACITINLQNGDTYFYLEQLAPNTSLDGFSCIINEYNDYLFRDALRSQNDHVALTWLLRERNTGIIIAYMSLIADAIKLSVSEKEIHNLNYPNSCLTPTLHTVPFLNLDAICSAGA